MTGGITCARRLARAIVPAVLLSAATVTAHGTSVLDGSSQRELAAVFGTHRSFAAVARLTQDLSAGEQPFTAVMPYFFREGDLRIENDLRTRSGYTPEMIEARVKQKTDRWINLVRAATGESMVVYPALRAYIANQANVPGGADATVSIEARGQKEIDGHACAGEEITVREGDSEARVTVWRALDLARFPIQVESSDHSGRKMVIRFTDVRFEQLAPSLFSPPDGYQRYGNMQELTEGQSRPK